MPFNDPEKGNSDKDDKDFMEKNIKLKHDQKKLGKMEQKKLLQK